MSDSTLSDSAAAVKVSAIVASAAQAATQSVSQLASAAQQLPVQLTQATVLHQALNTVMSSSVSMMNTLVQQLTATAMKAAATQAAIESRQGKPLGTGALGVAPFASINVPDFVEKQRKYGSGMLSGVPLLPPEKKETTEKEDKKTGFAGAGKGVEAAFDSYLSKAEDTATTTKAAFDKAFAGAETALYKFVTTGKSGFRELTKAIIADLERIALQQAIVWGVKTIASFFGGASAAPSSSFASGFGNNTSWLTSGNMTPNALGGVYASPSLSAYSGGVYNTPQLFAFAKGAGVFGEAGPEAIMPLQRGPDGRLGVAAHGGGGSGGGVGVSIRIDNNGGKEVTTNESMLQQFGNEIGQFVERKYRELQSRDLKAGGVLSRSAM